MPAQTVIKLRRDTASNWTTADSVLGSGEPGLETDTGRVKFGDGATAWTALGYGDSNTVAAPITLTGSEIGFDEVAAAKLEAPELTAVQNNTGSIVAKGAAVYVSGASGDNILITLSQADTEATSSKTFGLVYEEIPIGGQGYVVTFGRLSGLNTDGIAAGSAVWLSPTTAGGLIYGAPPVTPNHMVFIGYVIRSQQNNGEIFVEIQNGYELSELHDVLITSVTTGEVIQWDGSKWVNAQLDALPDQTGETGNYLTTDGSVASWAAIDIPPGTAISDTAPSTPDAGQLWWDSTDGTLYIYYDNFWVTAVTGARGYSGADGIDGINGIDGIDGVDAGFYSTQAVETRSGTSYTIVPADHGKLLLNLEAITITVEGLSVGQQVDFIQNVAGQMSFIAGAGITLNSKEGYTLTAAQYSVAGIKCIATNTYVLLGDLGI